MNNNYKGIQVYQFIDASRINSDQYVKKLLELELIICFDLEDSIKIFDNIQEIQSDCLKNIALDNIFKLLSQYHVKDLGVRVNESHTEEFKNDILLLSKLVNNSVHLQIFLPKVHSSLQIKIAVDTLIAMGLNNYELIPIIESHKGLENLAQIMDSFNEHVSKIAFGHCDYNYDCNIFPFIHQDSNNYWLWIKKIADRIGEKILFINSPFLKLNDHKGFTEVLKKLLSMNEIVGQVTLDLKQSMICDQFFRLNSTNNIEKPTITKEISLDTHEYANQLINEYKKYKLEGKSFSVDPVNRRIISPQEYLKAKIFIEEKYGVSN